MAPQQAGQAFPNFSLAVLGDFNGLGAKKFGDARLLESFSLVRDGANTVPVPAKARIITEAALLRKKLFGSLLVSS
jgi:hypothetical protein